MLFLAFFFKRAWSRQKEKKNRKRKWGESGKGGKRGNKVVWKAGDQIWWQSPWTLFHLFPLFPVVQRLIKFVENVRSRRTIFENKIVKIEENYHYNVLQCKRQISLQDWHLKMEYIVRISELFEDNNFLSTIARALRKIIWRHYLIIALSQKLIKRLVHYLIVLSVFLEVTAILKKWAELKRCMWSS